MSSMNFNEFLETLTEEQRTAVLACRTEEELEQVIDDYDIDIPDEMLVSVAGGKGFISIALAAIMMFTSAAPLVAGAAEAPAYVTLDANTSYDAVSYAASGDSTANAGTAISGLIVDTGLAALGEFIPGGSTLTPLVKALFGALIPDDGNTTTLDDINDNISQLHTDMNKRFDELDKKMDDSTKMIRSSIENQIAIGNSNEHLNSLVQKTNNMVGEIQTILDDDNKTNEEKYIAIAMRIKRNTEWDHDSNFIHVVEQAGYVLSGRTYNGLGNMNIYDYAYRECCNDVMFSGEAYDKADPYIESIIDKYMYAYAVAMQLLDVHREIANFTQTQLDALSDEAKDDYKLLRPEMSMTNYYANLLTNLSIDINSPTSVISHYAQFKYKQKFARSTFVNKGECSVVISPNLSTTRVSCDIPYGADYFYYSDYTARFEKIKESFKNGISNAASTSAISPDNIADLRNYVLQNYSGTSFNDYLDSMGISTVLTRAYSNGLYLPINSYVESGDKLTRLWCDDSDAQKALGYRDLQGLSHLYKEYYVKNYCGGFQTFNPNDSSAPTANAMGWTVQSWYTGVNLSPWFNYAINDEPIYMVTFQKGDQLNVPDTAAGIMDAMGISNNLSSISNNLSSIISYQAHVEGIGWQGTRSSVGDTTFTAGTTGSALRMEALIINLTNPDGSSAVQYRAHCEGYGWMDWKTSGSVAGTTGESKRMEAVEIKLTGEYAQKYDIVYRAHCEDYGWTDWVKNGETSGTTGQGKRMEAIEIKLVPKS